MTELCLQEINTADDDEDKLEKKKISYVWGEWFKGRDFLQYKLKMLSVLLYQVVGMIQCFFLKNNITRCCVFKLFLTGVGSK